VICIRNGKVTARPLNDAGYGDLITPSSKIARELWIGARDAFIDHPGAIYLLYLQEVWPVIMSCRVLEDQRRRYVVCTWGGDLMNRD